MKILVAVLMLNVALILIAVSDINQKLNKLIELNTPEYINVIPDSVIKE